MNKTFIIDLMSFACLKAANKLDPQDHGSNGAPAWADQIRGIWINSKDVLPENAAKLMVEHNVSFGQPFLRGSYYSHTYGFLAKCFRNKTFLLVPDDIALDDRLNLHNDKGPAIVFGQFKFHFSHGMFVNDTDAKKWIYTAPEDLDPQEILRIQNVDLRREMIRKKGIEQVLEGLFHRTIDTQGDYSLVQVMLGDSSWTACNYLKMLNPSVGCWHMEGVPNNLRTVREALLWRNQGWFEHAEKIT